MTEVHEVAVRPARREIPTAAWVIGLVGVGIVGLAVVRRPREASRPRPRAPARHASRLLAASAAGLSAVVCLDSALEHYRGGFFRRAMYVAPVVGAATLVVSLDLLVRPRALGAVRGAVLGVAMVTSTVGVGFHLHNVLQREGGLRWHNVFYGAPIAAPLGLQLAGVLGFASAALATRPLEAPSPLALRALGGVAAMGIAGTTAETAISHFRGAFHNPLMYVPVVVPPAASIALAAAVVIDREPARRLARALLRATVAVGLLGSGLHAFGVHRGMSGYRNASQNLLEGPPIPAPPSFSALALAGLAALELAGEAAS